MSSISADAIELVESLSRVTGLRLDLHLDEDRNLSLSSRDALSADEERLCTAVQVLLRRDAASAVTIARLREELRVAHRNNDILVQKHRALTEMASRDLLTGLYTRWFVKDKIEQELQRSKRHDFPMSVLMVDVDHFKQINDAYGHLVGDDVLREMGRLIRESLRTYDIPGRYGGEEFCLLLPSTEVDSTMTVAERLRERIERNLLEIPEGRLRFTASIGVAGLKGDIQFEQAEDLIVLADQALYRAKNCGRNRVELWECN